ncbi:hypothetical protein E2C01_067286 [Portunus trituberculatus]|uniref:Uncharacterized protein n=1 Tax=Portunus trituberculatus TaxID=210409 RepID=A0A5B7HKK8_PORTR|nr:hypothetical protein [Portunus trituberculatus]
MLERGAAVNPARDLTSSVRSTMLRFVGRTRVASVRTNLDDTFRRTDTILEKVHSWPKFKGGNMKLLSSKLRFQIRLEDLRWVCLCACVCGGGRWV